MSEALAAGPPVAPAAGDAAAPAVRPAGGCGAPGRRVAGYSGDPKMVAIYGGKSWELWKIPMKK